MYLVVQQICSAFGTFQSGKKYTLNKVPKDVIEDWLTQNPPLIEKIKLKEMEPEEQQEALDNQDEQPIDDDEPSNKAKKGKKKYSDQE